MKVGDYVRTVGGLIGKVIEKKGNAITYFMPNRQEDDVIDVIKSSPNIIDLIEVGDYVNGYKVSFVDEEPVLGKFVQCDYVVQFGTTNHYRFYEREIKSIVTKEQFESMEYKVNKND